MTDRTRDFFGNREGFEAAGRAFGSGLATGLEDRSRRNVVERDPYGWTAGGVIGLILVLLFAGGVIAFFYNGGAFVCDDVCWQSKKEIAIAEQTARRAVANADANSRAGFGNDDNATAQKAVPKTVVVTPPAPAPVPYVAPVVPGPPAPTFYPGVGTATWEEVRACLLRLGLKDGEFYSQVGPDGLPHAKLTDAVAARLIAAGKIGNAHACVQRPI